MILYSVAVTTGSVLLWTSIMKWFGTQVQYCEAILDEWVSAQRKYVQVLVEPQLGLLPKREAETIWSLIGESYMILSGYTGRNNDFEKHFGIPSLWGILHYHVAYCNHLPLRKINILKWWFMHGYEWILLHRVLNRMFEKTVTLMKYLQRTFPPFCFGH